MQPEAHLIDLEIGAEQCGCGHFLDGEFEGFGGGIEPLVRDPSAAFPAAAGKQLRRGVVIEPVASLRLLANLLADAFTRLNVVRHCILLASSSHPHHILSACGPTRPKAGSASPASECPILRSLVE